MAGSIGLWASGLGPRASLLWLCLLCARGSNSGPSCVSVLKSLRCRNPRGCSWVTPFDQVAQLLAGFSHEDSELHFASGSSEGVKV